MGKSSFVQTDFRGGFFSPSAQGLMDDPEYKRGLAECYNAYPTEQGTWTRRPPFYTVGYTRFGRPAKLISLSGATKNYYNMELSSGHLRVLHGPQLVVDATTQTVSSVSNDDPAICTTATNHGWNTGDVVVFDIPSPVTALLLASMTSRVFLIEVTGPTTFLLHDVITGKGYDGSTKATWDSTTFTVTVSRVTDVATPYFGDTYKAVKRVQTDRNVLLLHQAQWPQTLTYDQAAPAAWANTALAKTVLKDGPYLDAQPGATATPSALSGSINLTFSYQAYSSTTAYSKGDYVTSGTFHWRSLQDNNVNNTPADGSAFWARTSALDWVSKKALLETDIGRHVRLYSEPPDWTSGGSYSNGNVVKHNAAYWMAIQAATGAGAQEPGSGTSYWVPYASGAKWTWGIITGIAGGTKVTGTAFGNMTSGGGLAALFDGVTGTRDRDCAKHSGTSAYAGIQIAASTITHARLWPGNNIAITGVTSNPIGANGNITPIAWGITGFGGGSGTATNSNGSPNSANGGAAGGYTFDVGSFATVTINLRAKNSLPGSASDGTLLGSSGQLTYDKIVNAPVSVVSNDGTSTWTYVWFEIILNPIRNGAAATVCAAEAEFYTTGVQGEQVTVSILGDPLLYTGTDCIRTWQLGLFNDTDPTYPKCGCYHEGRVWFGLKNRFVATRPNLNLNGSNSQVLDFAPTQSDGTVTDGNGINYAFNSEVNADILWMHPTDGGIVLGMAGGERLLFSTAQDQAMTPTNINVELKTSYGSSDIEPAIAPLTSVFVHANGRDLHEYMRDAYSGRFVIPPLSERWKTLTLSGISQIAYQRALTSMVWACTNAGTLVGDTYERAYLPFRSESPPKYNGAHWHEHGANRAFLSVSVGPSIDGSPVEALAVVTQDRETGLCYVEVQGNLLPENSDIFDCNFLDGRYVPTGGGLFVLGNPTDAIAIPTPPPAPKQWRLPGWHLVTQCPALNAGAPTDGTTGTVASPVTGEGMTYLTPPTTLVDGSPCGFGGFVTSPQLPGRDVDVPSGSATTFTIAQYYATVFGSSKYFPYQHWAADNPSSPAPIGSGPTYS